MNIINSALRNSFHDIDNQKHMAIIQALKHTTHKSQFLIELFEPFVTAIMTFMVINILNHQK